LPSKACGCAALVVSDPLNAVVFALKLPPIVIGHLMLTFAWLARHGPTAIRVLPAEEYGNECRFS